MPATSSVLPPSNPTPVPLPAAGRHTEVEAYDLSFKVVQHTDNGLNEDMTLQRHCIKIDFGGGRITSFDTESKSLNTALEAIETIGRQIKNWDKAEFNKYVDSMEGKWIWFNMTSLSRDTTVKRDQVTAYKTDHHGRVLEYAFPEAKGFNEGPILIVEDKVIKQLMRIAKLLRAKLDDAADAKKQDAEKNDFMISLEKIN